MRTSDAIRTILDMSEKTLPSGLEGDVSTNIPLAIVLSARAICASLTKLTDAINYVGDEVSLFRKGVKCD